MRISKYIGRTLQDAIVQMKRELGEEAVVLSSRTIRKGNTAYIEITAGIDTPSSTQTRFNPAVQQYLEQLVHQLRSSQQPKDSTAPSKITLATEDPLYAPPYPESILRAWQAFLADGYAPHLLNSMMESVLSPLITQSPSAAVSLLLQQYLDRVPIFSVDRFFQSLPHRILVVGPSGSGKSSLVVKLSMWLHRHNYHPALWSLDTYIAEGPTTIEWAAKLLHLSFAQFHTAAELYTTLQQSAVSTYRLIIVDTPGRNIYDQSFFQELRSFWEALKPTLVVLVLPATLSFQQYCGLIAAFQPFSPSALAITKLDESLALGPLLSALVLHPIPVWLLSTGSELTEDFQLASKDGLMLYAQQTLEQQKENR